MEKSENKKNHTAIQNQSKAQTKLKSKMRKTLSNKM